MNERIEKEFQETLAFSDKLRNIGIFQDITAQGLAEKTNYPVSYVRRMLDNFQKFSIAHFEPALDYVKLPLLSALVGIKTIHPSYDEELAERLFKLDFVQSVCSVAGGEAWSQIVLVRVPSLKELKRLIEEKIQRGMKDMVIGTQTMLVYKYILDEQFVYPFAEDLQENAVEPDSKDWAIIACLKDDAAMTLNRISGEVGLTEPSVYRRIKRLEEEGVIKGYALFRDWPNVPPEKWPARAICMTRLNIDKLDRFGDELLRIKGIGKITFVYKVYSNYDIVLNVRSPSMISLRKFIYEDLSKIEGVYDTRTFIVMSFKRRNWARDFAAAKKEEEKTGKKAKAAAGEASAAKAV